MSLTTYLFRVWFSTLAGTVHYIELPAPCFDSAHGEAATLLNPGERVFAIDQLTGV